MSSLKARLDHVASHLRTQPALNAIRDRARDVGRESLAPHLPQFLDGLQDARAKVENLLEAHPIQGARIVQTLSNLGVDPAKLEAGARKLAATGFQRLMEGVERWRAAQAQAAGSGSAGERPDRAAATVAQPLALPPGVQRLALTAGPERVAPTAHADENAPGAASLEAARALLPLFGGLSGKDAAFRAELSGFLESQGVPDLPALRITPAPEQPMRKQAEEKARNLLTLVSDERLPTELRALAADRLGVVGDRSMLGELQAIAANAPAPLAGAAREAQARIQKAQKLDIVLVTWEMKPFSGAGGLSNVMMEYARAMVKAGHRVTTVAPFHKSMEEAKNPNAPEISSTGKTAAVFGPSSERIHLRTADLDGVECVFIENDRWLSQNDSLYPADDAAARNDFFSACAPAALALHRREEGVTSPDILHANDAQAAASVAYLKESGLFPETATLYAVHNNGEAYQGRYGAEELGKTRLEGLDYFRWADPSSPAENFGDLVLGKVGLTKSDGVMAVSNAEKKAYVQPESGKLCGVFQSRDARGELYSCLNGVDTRSWNPATDALLDPSWRFTPQDRSGKARCKEALQERYSQDGRGLEKKPGTTLIGVVSRIDGEQKAMDDIVATIRRSAERGDDVQFIVCGDKDKGDAALAGELERLAAEYPRIVAFDGVFSSEKEHQIIAGADVFLMPSRREPCGLPDKYSKSYFTAVLGRNVGGIAEGTQNFDATTGEGNGILFEDIHEGMDRMLALRRDNPEAFERMLVNASEQDFSWENSAVPEMTAIYRDLLDKKAQADANV